VVLARTGHDTDLLELELSRRRIPFVKYGGLRYLEAAHVKDFLALLRLTDRVTDEMSWFRVLMLLEGVGPARARRCLDELLAGGLLSTTQLPERWRQARTHLPTVAQEQGDAVAAALAAGPDAERLRDALAPVVRAHYVDGAVRMLDLDALCGLARDAGDLRTFVAELLLDPPASSADLAGPASQDEDWLVLSTVHSAKGLEWQAVHIVAAYDGNFPSDLAADSRESLAEERRLLYVALTRARRSLTVYVPRRYYHRKDRSDGHGYGKASRFLSAAAQACCDVVHRGDDPRQTLSAVAAPGRRIEVSVDDLFT
jgi:DNA helicase-2/ATP-dependent DNA helicase PcrA